MARNGPIIFLSYAREDKEHIDELYRRLVHAGLNPWMDDPPLPYQREGILPGADWKATVRTKLSEAGLFFACFSKRSIEKVGFVQREYKLAVDRLNELPPGRTFLVAVLLEECSPREIRIDTQTLNSRQWYRLYRDGLRGLIQLGERVASGEDVSLAFEQEADSLLTEEPLTALGDSLELANKEFKRVLDNVLERMRRLADEFVAWRSKLDVLPRPVSRNSAKALFRTVASEMKEFHGFMGAKTIQLEQIYNAMAKNFGEAMAVASDTDFMNRELFERKLEQVRSQREHLSGARDTALQMRRTFLSLKRGPTSFNRTRRLGAEACRKFADLLETICDKNREAEREVLRAVEYVE